jgi:probable rRNA maturation factor
MTSPKKDPVIAVQIREDFQGPDLSLPRLRKLVRTVCRRFADREDLQTTHVVSIAIVDDAEITRLNARFLGRNAVTDCLSFDLSDAKRPQAGAASSRTLELIVNGELAVRQAASRGHSAEAELALYVTHGLLHQFGFDDCTPRKARKMHGAEDTILQELGYGTVYNNNGPGRAHGPAPTV